MNTPIRALLCLVSSCTLIMSAKADTGARVYCWAPHLDAPILLDSYGMGVGSYAGRPYNYKILGVAGSLTLGSQTDGGYADRNTDSSDSSYRFYKSRYWSGAAWEPIEVGTSVRLQVNYAQYYPEKLEIIGDRPATTTGAVRRLGDVWNTNIMFGYPEVTLVFHLAGNGLYPYTNRDPHGFFYVVAEYQLSAPEVSGELNISGNLFLKDSTTPVGYSINRSGGSSSSTPPFTGYDQSGEVTFVAE